MEAVLIAFGTVFVAELGDKSQLVALSMAARGRAIAVLVGIAAAVAVLQALAVGVGTGLSSALPDRALEIGSGLVFVAAGIWTLVRSDGTDGGEDGIDARPDIAEVAAPDERSDRRVAVTSASAFFLAEFGDKTQLATLVLASTYGALGTWAGATLGQVSADVLAIVIGARLGSRLPRSAIAKLSAVLFLIVGLLLLAGIG
jgi:Ca2+/H+ antiporter, TMEM165/GDT1 family